MTFFQLHMLNSVIHVDSGLQEHFPIHHSELTETYICLSHTVTLCISEFSEVARRLQLHVQSSESMIKD